MDVSESLSLIVPAYQEQDNVLPLYDRVKVVLDSLDLDWELIFSVDPCPDRTEEVILDLRARDPRVKMLRFSRRFGQPMATLAGLEASSGDAAVVIDCDLQDPPELIAEMVQRWRDGYDVVYAQRRSRAGETLPKRFVAWAGYKVIKRIAEVDIPPNTGDFRLMSRRVIDNIVTLKESHGFLRGLVGLVGFRQTSVLYDRDPRAAGQSKYNQVFGSLVIGLNGVIGFSRYPLHLISLLGVVFSALSFLLAIAYLFLKLAGVGFPTGNPTIVIVVAFFSGIQLLSLGVMGEYVGRIYDESTRSAEVHRGVASRLRRVRMSRQGRVLVTGGSTGIGLAVSHALAARGDRVIIAARRHSALEEALAALPGAGHQRVCLDVSDHEAWVPALAEIDADGALHGSGDRCRRPGAHRALDRVDPRAFAQAVSINLLGTAWPCTTASPACARRAAERSLCPGAVPPHRSPVTTPTPLPRQPSCASPRTSLRTGGWRSMPSRRVLWPRACTRGRCRRVRRQQEASTTSALARSLPRAAFRQRGCRAHLLPALGRRSGHQRPPAQRSLGSMARRALPRPTALRRGLGHAAAYRRPVLFSLWGRLTSRGDG